MNKVVQKDSLSGSVSKIGFGDPFFSRAFKIFRKPVFRPSVRCISFKNSPILRFLYRWAWRNGSTKTLKAAISAGASPRRLRTSWLPSIPSRSKTFWMTTPCFSTGAVEISSADTGRQKAGTVSSLPTTQRSAGQASAAGKVDKRPSVRSAFAIWWKTLVPIFHLCFACEVW